MLSVVIVNWNTRDHLRACLKSIFANPPAEPYEVIVVDNDSKDESAEMVRAEFADVTLIESDRNLGYASGNNRAFSVAKGEWLLTLNPDTELNPGTLDTAISKLRKGSDIGVVAAKLVHPGGKVQRSVRGWPTATGIFGELTGLAKLFPLSALGSYRMSKFDYESEQPAPQPMGTFLLFKREALASVGDPAAPFDASFPIFFNDVDLLYRLHRAGWKCLYSPEVVVIHDGGESTRQVKKSMIWESHRSLVRYLNKHYRTRLNAIGLSLVAWVIYLAAFIRAKGYDVGFSG